MHKRLSDITPLLSPPQGESVRMLFGTVATTSPFKVTIDGDTVATPASRTVTASVGDRVVLLLQSRVLVAIGVVN